MATPSPGLSQIGEIDATTSFNDGVVCVVKKLEAEGGPITGTVRRLAEPVQVDPEVLQQLRDAGVVPGAHGSFEFNEGYVLVQIDEVDGALELPIEMAAHVFLVAE